MDTDCFLPAHDLFWNMVRPGDLLYRWDDPDLPPALVLEDNKAMFWLNKKLRVDSLWTPENRLVSSDNYRVYRPEFP